MTIAQKLREEGLSQGRLQALQGNVVEALEVRFGSVLKGLRETIQATAEEAKLHDLLRAAIRCPTLDAFAAQL